MAAAPGNPSTPVVVARGGSIGNNTEVSLSQLIDASFGNTRSQGLYRGATSWGAQTAVGPFPVYFNKSGAIAVGTDVTNWNIIPTAWNMGGYALCLKTGPVGAHFIIDIMMSLDGGTSFTTIFTNTIDRPLIHDGSTYTFGYLFDVTTFIANTIFRLDIIQVGSPGTTGSDLAVTLFGNADVETLP